MEKVGLASLMSVDDQDLFPAFPGPALRVCVSHCWTDWGLCVCVCICSLKCNVCLNYMGVCVCVRAKGFK